MIYICRIILNIKKIMEKRSSRACGSRNVPAPFPGPAMCRAVSSCGNYSWREHEISKFQYNFKFLSSISIVYLFYLLSALPLAGRYCTSVVFSFCFKSSLWVYESAPARRRTSFIRAFVTDGQINRRRTIEVSVGRVATRPV